MTAWTLSLQSLAQTHFHFAAAILFVIQALFMLVSLPAKAAINMITAALLGFWPGVFLTLAGALTGTTGLFAMTRRFSSRRNPEELPPLALELKERLSQKPVLSCAALRLMPFLPYGPVTIACAITRMSWRQFAIGSTLGDLPIVVLYAMAGTRLMSLTTTSEALSLSSTIVLTAAGVLLLVSAFLPGRRLSPRRFEAES